MSIERVSFTSLFISFRLYIVGIAYQARFLSGASKYQFPNLNTKEHFECVIYMDDIDVIAVNKIQNAGVPSTTGSISGADRKRIISTG